MCLCFYTDPLSPSALSHDESCSSCTAGGEVNRLSAQDLNSQSADSIGGRGVGKKHSNTLQHTTRHTHTNTKPPTWKDSGKSKHYHITVDTTRRSHSVFAREDKKKKNAQRRETHSTFLPATTSTSPPLTGRTDFCLMLHIRTKLHHFHICAFHLLFNAYS